MLSTIDRVTAGHIYYENTDITELSEDQVAEFRKKNLGFVFQEYNLLDTLTLEENVMLAMSLRKEKKSVIEKQCQDMLKLLGIEEVKNQFPYQVSGGQKQRCACARALVNHPKLILADEPTGALDSKSSRDLLGCLKTVNEAGNATILMVTHDAFSASYAKQVYFLKDGSIQCRLNRRGDRKAFYEEIITMLVTLGGDEA